MVCYWKKHFLRNKTKRVAQLLLGCLQENTNTNSNFRKSLKKLIEKDFNIEKKQSLLHIVASKTYSKVMKVLKFFVEDCKVEIDLTDETGRSIRVIAIANQNNEISTWAKKWGTYLKRYRIEGGNGATEILWEGSGRETPPTLAAACQACSTLQLQRETRRPHP